MLAEPRAIAEIDARGGALDPAWLSPRQPLVLRGLVAHWPLAQAGRGSAQAAIDYLRGFGTGEPVIAQLAPPEIGGRFFYNAAMDGFNFQSVRVPLAAALDTLARYLDAPGAPALYIGSTTIDTWLPGLRAANPLDFGAVDPLASIWIGNRTRIAAHQDVPDNIACVVAGRRRFTIFPPDQLANLYIGPLDFNPAGQAISLVDFAAPDLQRFPRFAQAMEHAQSATLEPGDALLLPSLWWHHIEALEAFNVLVNYWWRQSPEWMDTPMNALMLAIMSVRDLPPDQRRAWRTMFEHYVFDAGEDTAAHIPADARRVLAPLDEARARWLRGRLLQRLNR
ncbi:MAG: cupin-like domain-containing protein [Pseudoxanthomonas sp.]